jgi:hypothetical protein
MQPYSTVPEHTGIFFEQPCSCPVPHVHSTQLILRGHPAQAVSALLFGKCIKVANRMESFVIA